ncbi:unnamed protein product [Rotaria sordida]|uniref:Uncharacterized protein n=1 Tax=Rotaria sordida TaxID=392033 RepID=A0A819XPT7_9BILA|nr:unnamed protein product [Rotaria sordida]
MVPIIFWNICFKSDGDYKNYDEMVRGALNDDFYQKVYPGIASEILLGNLIKFVQDINNRPTKDGVENGTLYKKANGRQIDSSRRYYLVKEPNLNEFNLYAKITKGRNLGYYQIHTNEDEVELLIRFGLNYLKQQATLPIVADYVQFAQDSKYLITRERCEFISRLLNNNVAVARESSNVDYDVTKLVTRQKETQKCSKETAATTVSSSTSTSTRQSRVQKQVLSSRKTTSSSSAANKSIDRSQSSSAERSQSPPPQKKQTNNKSIKNQQEKQLSKTTTEQTAPTSYLRSTPILNRLRAIPNGRTAVSSSSSTSSRPIITVTKSKKKQIISAKKRKYSSENEENDDGTSVLHVPTTSIDAKPIKGTNDGTRNKRMKK